MTTEEQFLPILAAAVVVAVSLFLSRPVVEQIAAPQSRSRKPFMPHWTDAAPFLVGFAAMTVSGAIGVIAGHSGSVWSYFIDLGSFAVGASVVATSDPKTYPRVLGLLILGIHTAQVVLTNDNAPLFELLQGATASDATR